MARVSERDRLLNEGLASYLEAIAALRVFRQEAFLVCRKVVERAIPRMEKALKHEIPKGSVIEYSEPSGRGDAFLDAEYAWIGVSFGLSKAKLFYAGMGWWSDANNATPYLRASAALWLGGQSTALQIKGVLVGQALKMVSGPESGDPELWVERRVLPQTSRGLEKALEGCLRAWIDLWSRGGGFAKILSKAKLGAF